MKNEEADYTQFVLLHDHNHTEMAEWKRVLKKEDKEKVEELLKHDYKPREIAVQLGYDDDPNEYKKVRNYALNYIDDIRGNEGHRGTEEGWLEQFGSEMKPALSKPDEPFSLSSLTPRTRITSSRSQCRV